jgi:hypothetical protein
VVPNHTRPNPIHQANHTTQPAGHIHYSNESSLTMQYRTKHALESSCLTACYHCSILSLGSEQVSATANRAPYPVIHTDRTYVQEWCIHENKRSKRKGVKMSYFLMMYFYKLQKLPKCNRHEIHQIGSPNAAPKESFLAILK